MKQKRLLSILLTLAMVFALFPAMPQMAMAADESGVDLSSLSEFRKWFFRKTPATQSFSADPNVIFIDRSDIIHVPQEYIQPTIGGIQAAMISGAAAPLPNEKRDFSSKCDSRR